MNDQLISADEARCIAQNSQLNKETENMEMIIGAINRAVKTGALSVHVPKVLPRNKNELNHKGYTVTPHRSGYDETEYIISWKLTD